MTNPVIQFVYLLNALESAAQQECPANHDYGAKREAVVDFVRKLAAAPPAVAASPCPHVRSSAEGTSYCSLAEDGVRLAEARADELCAGFKLLAAEAAPLRQENDKLKRLINEHVFGDMTCLPECDSYGHDELCPATNAANAFTTLRQRLAEAEQSNEFRAMAIEAALAQRDDACAKWQAAEQQVTALEAALQPVAKMACCRGLVTGQAECGQCFVCRARLLTRPAPPGAANSEPQCHPIYPDDGIAATEGTPTPQPVDVEAIIARECSFSDEADAVRRCAPAIIAAASRTHEEGTA